MSGKYFIHETFIYSVAQGNFWFVHIPSIHSLHEELTVIISYCHVIISYWQYIGTFALFLIDLFPAFGLVPHCHPLPPSLAFGSFCQMGAILCVHWLQSLGKLLDWLLCKQLLVDVRRCMTTNWTAEVECLLVSSCLWRSSLSSTQVGDLNNEKDPSVSNFVFRFCKGKHGRFDYRWRNFANMSGEEWRRQSIASIFAGKMFTKIILLYGPIDM